MFSTKLHDACRRFVLEAIDPTVIHKIIILKSFRYLKLLKLKRVACQTDAFYKNKRSKAASLYAPLKQNIYEVVWWELCPRPWSLFSPEEHRTTRFHTEPRGSAQTDCRT